MPVAGSILFLVLMESTELMWSFSLLLVREICGVMIASRFFALVLGEIFDGMFASRFLALVVRETRSVILSSLLLVVKETRSTILSSVFLALEVMGTRGAILSSLFLALYAMGRRTVVLLSRFLPGNAGDGVVLPTRIFLGAIYRSSFRFRAKSSLLLGDLGYAPHSSGASVRSLLSSEALVGAPR